MATDSTVKGLSFVIKTDDLGDLERMTEMMRLVDATLPDIMEEMWMEAEKEKKRLRQGLQALLAEVQASEADSESDHAGCLHGAAGKLQALLKTEEETEP